MRLSEFRSRLITDCFGTGAAWWLPALLGPKRNDYNHYLPAGRNQFFLGAVLRFGAASEDLNYGLLL
jgi:hypothetical protein